LALDISYRS